MASKGASKTLFVGNLHASLEENDLLELFKPFGRIIECCKRWCHYGFIQFAVEEEAQLAYNSLNGSKLRGRPMRIEFQRKKLRNLQALFEAEGDAKMNMNNARSNDNFSQYAAIASYGQYGPAFGNMNTDCESDHFQDNVSSISSMDDNHNNLENMNRIFDELMNEQVMNRPFQPLGAVDANRQPLFVDNGQDYKKKSESIKKYSQMIKPMQKPSYLNNTSEFLKSLIHESIMLNPSNHCSSPISSKNGISPKKALNRVIKNSQLSNSVNFFRSINNSHTIMVEPTDVLEPLNEGEFNEYKLFPTTACGQGAKRKDQQNANMSNEIEMDLLGDYSPQSLSLSCSNLSSVSSSMVNSPSHLSHMNYNLIPDTIF